ncbi:MAG: branched-chain amino acid ABC transporter substrate-binding protein [Deltaproteobacteria bacterium]|nr:branched-chain amino acid ABC transporter substrate-binding protein [Deltaproteobacteria bacterium]
MKDGCKNGLLKTAAMVLALIVVFAFSLSTAIAAPKAKAGKKTTNETVNAATGMRLENFPDMSDYDPNNPIIPTGDTIKVAIVGSFSGPGAINGQLYFNSVQWAAHAINKKGGIYVDGKKKLIEVFKADHMSNTATCKKVSERMVLKEKAQFLLGSDGSHMQKIINETAGKYKVIAVSVFANSDDLQDAVNFNRYAFQSSFSTEQMGRGLAYYYGQIRKKETKFYILNQDYSYGRGLAEGFKKGMQEYYPAGQIVGEDYHKLFLTDFAPYLTKIKASGAEVIFTGDWAPDAGNLLKQARQLGVTLPFCNLYMDEPNSLGEVGVEGTKGLINITQYGAENPALKTEADKRYYKMWHELWKTWKIPYNTTLYQYPWGNIGSWTEQVFWLFSVIERAKSTDPEKIIPIWEGDTFKFMNNKIVTMRACDHKIIQDLHINEYLPPEQQNKSMTIPPYYWTKNSSNTGLSHKIPADKVLPWMDQKLDRCKGKNNWGK